MLSERSEISVEYKLKLALENIVNNRKSWQEEVNKGIKHIEYQLGDKVLIRKYNLSNANDSLTAKFMSIYEGPYVVTDTLEAPMKFLRDLV